MTSRYLRRKGADVGNVAASVNSFGAKGQLEVGDASYTIFRLAAVDGSATPASSASCLMSTR